MIRKRSWAHRVWKFLKLVSDVWAGAGPTATPDDKESIATIHRAMELGCNFLDTEEADGRGHVIYRLQR